MDSRIAALRAHVKERGTSNSKAGPTLTFYIRYDPVCAAPVAVVVVVVVDVVVAFTHTTTRRRDTYTRALTHT